MIMVQKIILVCDLHDGEHDAEGTYRFTIQSRSHVLGKWETLHEDVVLDACNEGLAGLYEGLSDALTKYGRRAVPADDNGGVVPAKAAKAAGPKKPFSNPLAATVGATPDQPFECMDPECRRAFATKSAKRKHERNAHGVPHPEWVKVGRIHYTPPIVRKYLSERGYEVPKNGRYVSQDLAGLWVVDVHEWARGRGMTVEPDVVDVDLMEAWEKAYKAGELM